MDREASSDARAVVEDLRRDPLCDKAEGRLVRCFTDGKFEIDNGEVERQLRRVGVGRNNFAGSDQGAVRAAIAYSVLASCRMHNVDPFAYVRDVLEKIGDGWPQARLDELLPQNRAPAGAVTG